LNAIIGFVEEVRAGDAVAKLKSKLAPQANVCRDGAWHELPAKELVPGDLIDLKLGDVIPADGIILPGFNPVDVDQSALTGESLPAQIGPGGHLKMGAMLKTGQIRAIIVATGSNTFFGDAARLISSVEDQGHLRAVINSIVLVMCSVCVVFCACILARLLTLPYDSQAINVPAGAVTSAFLQALSVVVVILVASIPVAIEVVSTSTLAVGSHIMSEKQVIVAKLAAIEELAGMTVLCSDKTGTLTLNQLRLDDNLVTALPINASTSGALLASSLGAKGDLLDMSGTPGPDNAPPSLVGVPAVKKLAALASKRDGKPDAIDTCIVK
jgi:H+-transporting ATPase